MSKYEKKLIDCMKFCLSKDETRRNLMGFCHDEKLQALVTCNGYSLFYSKRMYDFELKNKLIDPNTFRLINREPPNYTTIVPDASKLETMTVTLDKVHYIKSKGPTKLFIMKDGSIKLIDTPENEDLIFRCLDTNLLKPLCDGSAYTIGYSPKNNLGPVIFSLNDESFESAMIVMPMKY